MKCVLAIETSTARGSLALRREGELIFSATFLSARTHNSVIFAPLAEALALAEGLDCLVVGTGPGSYTGVRVGLAVAVGIALSQGVPMIGWNSLAAVAEAPPHYAVVGDARRQQWHFTEIVAGEMVSGPWMETEALIASRCAAFSGPLLTLDAASPPFCVARCVVPEASVLAARAERLSPEEVAARQGACVEPIYLSAPFITVPKGGARA